MSLETEVNCARYATVIRFLVEQETKVDYSVCHYVVYEYEYLLYEYLMSNE